jgi:hypothetical protein
LVFKFFGEVCLNYMTSVKAGYLLKALTGKSKIGIEGYVDQPTNQP